MRRLLSFALALLLLITALTACGGGGNSNVDGAPQDKNQGAGGAPAVTAQGQPQDADNALVAASDTKTEEGISFQEQNGVLTVSGSGKVKKWDNVSDPDSITAIEFQEGITGFPGIGCFPNLTEITIPGTCDNIFVGESPKLASVVIQSGAHRIESTAFSRCSSLTSITIPDSITEIGSNAFYECSSLTSITIPDGVTEIAGSTFAGCSSLTSITIPDSVTKIGRSAFSECSSLTSIAIPDSVSEIEISAFSGCSSLTSMTIPDGVTKIEEGTFYKCSSLKSLTIPASVEEITLALIFTGASYALSIETNLTDITFLGETILKPDDYEGFGRILFLPNVTVHAPSGSPAEAWATSPEAQSAGMTFIPLEG